MATSLFASVKITMWLKTYGDTSKYLLQKNFTLNLADLLPKPLAVAFNTAVSSAKKNK
ncbi:MAG: hypothetical protein WDM90_24390 [Ferruginibacter sp.]